MISRLLLVHRTITHTKKMKNLYIVGKAIHNQDMDHCFEILAPCNNISDKFDSVRLNQSKVSLTLHFFHFFLKKSE